MSQIQIFFEHTPLKTPIRTLGEWQQGDTNQQQPPRGPTMPGGDPDTINVMLTYMEWVQIRKMRLRMSTILAAKSTNFRANFIVGKFP